MDSLPRTDQSVAKYPIIKVGCKESQGLSLCSKHGVRVCTSTRSEHNLGNLSCSSVMRFERKAVVGREAEEGYLLGRI